MFCGVGQLFSILHILHPFGFALLVLYFSSFFEETQCTSRYRAMQKPNITKPMPGALTGKTLLLGGKGSSSSSWLSSAMVLAGLTNLPQWRGWASWEMAGETAAGVGSFSLELRNRQNQDPAELGCSDKVSHRCPGQNMGLLGAASDRGCNRQRRELGTHDLLWSRQRNV